MRVPQHLVDRRREELRGLIRRDGFLPVAEIDKILQGERVDANRQKITYDRELDKLPNGTFFEFEGDALMVWENHLLRWSFDGYLPHRTLPRDKQVIIYCANGNRSAFAADTLQQMGYDDVASLAGGFREAYRR